RRYSHQGPDLGRHHMFDFAFRHRDNPPTKAFAIRITRMRSDHDATLGGGRQGFEHGFGIACVTTAGDIGARNQRHHRIVTHRPGAETFSEVGVQIDPAHENLGFADFRRRRYEQPMPPAWSTMLKPVKPPSTTPYSTCISRVIAPWRGVQRSV